MQSVAPFAENTRFFTISTAGHVDHGKTSLLRALTGIDPDRLKEEKERQMTIDLGFAHLRLPGNLLAGFVDVPGHGRFLKNMLAGVGGLDMALLVVAADEGAMPQTLQHLRILSMLGVKPVLPVITKIDMVEADQSRLVVEQIEGLIAEHHLQLVGSCLVSSVKGSGIEELKTMLAGALTSLPARSANGSAFLPVDRVFNKQGFGTIVTGTLVRGMLAVGDNISLAPDSVPGRVRRLETFGVNVEKARAGQRVACNIVLKEPREIVRGFVICGQQVEPARSLLVSVIDDPQASKARLTQIIQDQPVRFYHGTAECHGRIRWAEDGESERSAIAFIALAEPVAAQPQDRFVIRLADDSIYGGAILVREKPRWLNRKHCVNLSRLLQNQDLPAAVLETMEAAPQAMIKQSLVADAFFPDDSASQVIDDLASRGKLVRLGEAVMKADVLSSLSSQAQQLVGVETSLEKLRLGLKPKLDRSTFGFFLEKEVAAGRLIRQCDRLQLPGAAVSVAVTEEELRARTEILDMVSEHLCIEAAAVQDKLKALGLKAGAIDSMVKAGQLVRVDREFLSTRDNLQKAHQVLADIWQVKRNITPGEFREKSGTTRKYAMALLSYFDDQTITRRLNEGRVLLKQPKPTQ
jgi:selenocysteine-specific elongation factor